MNNPVVRAALLSEGKNSLPMTLIDGKIVVKGRYPVYEELRQGASQAQEEVLSPGIDGFKRL